VPWEVVAVLIGLLAAVITAVAGYWVARYQQREHARQAEQARDDEAVRVVRKYRDPLVRAAFDLQSRLYNIMIHDFLGKYYVRGSEAEKVYARDSTLFVVGDFLGWVEIMRREIQFLDLRDVTKNRELALRLDAISHEFLRERPDTTFRIFRAEQRAIGELMIETQAGGARECIGFAMFAERLSEKSFGRWFDKLRADIELLAREPGQHFERIVLVQHTLLDLVEFLDPDDQYFPRSMRSRVSIALEVRAS